MIPILYNPDETDFGHHGIGDLVDCLSAHVTEQRNGKFELEFVYPVTGQWFDQIKEDCIVKAKPNDIAADQLFRIYQSTKPIDGKVTFNARHISYDLAYNPLPKTALSGSASAAINQILDGALNTHPFIGFSDSTTESTSEIGPCTVREALGGVDGSLLDNWGGEYEFDNFTIKHHAQRGRDTGVLIEYGKNLTDFNQERALADVFTSVYAYAKKQDDQGNEQLITLDDKIYHLASEDNYPIKRTLMLDLSGNDTVTDSASLKAAAEKYAQDNKIDQPSVSWSIKFQNLRKTEDYKDVAILETCSLCDYVTIRFRQYGVDVKAEIIEADYNVLLEQYNSMDLGDPVSNFITDYQNQQKKTQKQFDQTTNFFTDAIDRATQAITGASGGYVRLIPSRNPQQIVIMDTPDINTAMRVWRWNLGGLGYSKNGYNGPYELAMTMDGEIVADFITAGVLRAIDIEGVRIKGSTITGYDPNGSESTVLDDSGLQIFDKGRRVLYLWSDGVDFYNGDQKVGGIAEQYKLADPSKHGVALTLNDGKFISFSFRNDGTYNVLMELAKESYDDPVTKYGLNMYSGIHMHGNTLHLDNDAGDKNKIYENTHQGITIESPNRIALVGDNGWTMLQAQNGSIDMWEKVNFNYSINAYNDLFMHGWSIRLDNDAGNENKIYENTDHVLTLDSSVGIQLLERTGENSVVMLYASRDLHNRMTIDTYADLDMHGWYLKNANIQDASLAELKQDIKPYDDYALDVIKKVKIYRFRFKKEATDGTDHEKYGPIIGDGYGGVPNEISSPDKKGVDPYNERHLMMKAIQELSDKVDRLEKRITELGGAVKHAD